MPYEIKNKLRGPSTLFISGVLNTGLIPLTAFSANQAIENVTSLYITSVKWSLLPNTGSLVISRGAPITAVMYETGSFSEDEFNMSNTINDLETIRVVINGGGSAFLTLNKTATYNVDTQTL